MANCRACTAPLPDDATACPSCDEPVPPPKKRRTSRAKRAPKEHDVDGVSEPEATDGAGGEKPAGQGGDDRLHPDSTPGNDALLAMGLGIASCVLGLLPCVAATYFSYMPAFGLTIGSAAIAIWKGTVELDAIREETAPQAGQKAANVGRLTGFLGAVLGIVSLVARIAYNNVSWKHH